MPFIHERKVYLNRMKERHEYFYTVMDPQCKHGAQIIISIDFSRYIYFVYSMSGILLGKVDFNERVKQYGKPVEVSENGLNYIFQDEQRPSLIHVMCLKEKEIVHIKSIDIIA